MSSVIIHVDESCLKNPGPGGASALLEFQKPDGMIIRRDAWYAEQDTTNNRMAIWSAIIGLSALKTICKVYLVSDSKYLLNGIRKNGYGPDAKNSDLWKKLMNIIGDHELVLKWVKGHNGNKRNEYVDLLARYAAKKQSIQIQPVESQYMIYYWSGEGWDF